MKDLKREILNQVASGKISAEEGAARLDSLESVESASPAGASRPAPPPFQAAPSGTRRVRVATASGRLAGGASKVRCEMGNVTINLDKGSSVRVTARTTLGKVAVDSGGGEQIILGQSGKEVTLGSGAGTLDIECTMGNVRVSA